MPKQEIIELYKKFRLAHYRSLFGRIKEKDGSLSATEAYSVDVIYLLGNPSIKQFSDYIGISQPNATYKISSLISKGYVVKLPSEEDRREYRLSVSDKFYTYFDEHNQFITDAVEKLEKKYTPQELRKFAKMLESLNNAVD